MPRADTRPKARTLVTKDGLPLRHFFVAGEGRGVAFLGHGQAQHSLNTRATAHGLANAGFDVHMTDLRGHGHSTGERAPLAHMEMGRGWDDLVADMRLALEHAFDGVPWADRLIVAPNIGALLVLEVLKTWPDLAQRIVLVAPPPDQKAVVKMGRNVTKARALIRAQTKPDELLLHHLFSFLAAQIEGSETLVDVVSSDRAITDALLADPLAWPTPTTGYFYEMFRGIAQAWTWPGDVQVAQGTQMLILYGDEDPVTSNGRFIAPMRAHLEGMGIADVTMQCVAGGRAGMIIDEARLGISRRIGAWAEGRAQDVSSQPEDTSMTQVSTDILTQFGLNDYDEVLSPDTLVELCYNAIDDEKRWVEILYRLTYALSRDVELSEVQLEGILGALMPHWDRSYQLNRQIMQSAAVGAVLENVIERFRIGMAILNDGFEVSYANASFVQALEAVTGETIGENAGTSRLNTTLGPMLDTPFRASVSSGTAETLWLHEGVAIGFHMRPRSLSQTAIMRGGASSVLILRDPNAADGSDTGASVELLQFAYGLTEKEAMTALCLLDGLSPSEISERLDVSIHTTRTHLKRIYEKTGVANKTELVSRLLMGPMGLVVGT